MALDSINSVDFTKQVTTQQVNQITKFDFDQMLIAPNAKLASIVLEYKDSDGTTIGAEVVGLSDADYLNYFGTNPTTAPLVAAAVQASRAAWIAILQDMGKLPAGDITDTWPN